MKNSLRHTIFILVGSAFCVSSAFADEGIGQVIQQHNAKVLQQTQGAGAKDISQACKDNPNSEACAKSKSQIRSHRETLHEQRMGNAPQNTQSQVSQ